RPLTLEVWYPAALPEGVVAGGTYDIVTRDGTPAQLKGRGVRDAEPAVDGGPYPLVVLSHGYPGNRFLIAHFGENLASKGYVVVSIDH
ncbi:MAG: dienelactone hydrolase, partial [Trueperaceae bacterium]